MIFFFFVVFFLGPAKFGVLFFFGGLIGIIL
jgi:hypothetical protein